MSNLSNLRKALEEIRNQLSQRPAFIYGFGAGEEDPSYQKEKDIFERLQAELSIAIREYQRKGGGSGPEAQETLRLARTLRKQLHDIAIKNESESKTALFAEALEKLHEYHEMTEHHHTLTGAEVHPLHNEFPMETTLEGTAVLLFAIIASFVAKRRKKK